MCAGNLLGMDHSQVGHSQAGYSSFEVTVVNHTEIQASLDLTRQYLNERYGVSSNTVASSKRVAEYLMTKKVAQFITAKLNRAKEHKWRLFWDTLREDVRSNRGRLPTQVCPKWVNIENIFSEQEITDLLRFLPHSCVPRDDVKAFLEDALVEVSQLILNEDL
jgi:hypothetical protein